jgi:hypothetical protein
MLKKGEKYDARRRGGRLELSPVQEAPNVFIGEVLQPISLN